MIVNIPSMSKEARFVYDVLVPYVPSSDLLNIRTSQGEAFSRLGREEGSLKAEGEELRDPRKLLQRFGLLSFYYQTGGPNNWYDSFGWDDKDGKYTDECDFVGIKCTNFDLEVEGLPGLPGDTGTTVAPCMEPAGGKSRGLQEFSWEEANEAVYVLKVVTRIEICKLERDSLTFSYLTECHSFIEEL